MFTNLLKGILSAIAVKVLDNYRHLSIQLLKIETAKSFLHGVRLVRMSVIGLMGLGLVIMVIGLGALLFHVGLFVLLPWTLETKAVMGMILGVLYVTVGCVVLHKAMDERTWMKKSGADRMLEDATGHSSKD